MRKRISMFLALTLTIGLLAGCGSSSEKTSADATKTENTEVSESSEEETSAPEAEAFLLSGDVEFVCPFSAGGGSDLYARTIANIISEQGLIGNHTITVNNKTGGGGAVGDAYTATKKPDGTTITTYVSAQVTSPMVNGSGITYDQLTPICNLAMDEYLIGILSTAEYQTVDEFIAYAKEHPGELTVGGSGSGTEDEVCTGLIELYCDIDLTYVAYDSSSEVMTAVLGEHISAGIFNPNECISQYEAGQVTLLAAFGPERISVLPEIATFTELGYENVQFQQFRGIFGPGGMSDDAVAYWCDIFEQAVQAEEWTQGYLGNNGLTAKFLEGEEFRSFMNDEAEKYEKVLDAVGLLAE